MSDLLEIRDLTIQLPQKSGSVTLVDGIDLQIKQGECFGVVGESGCGKSITAFSIAQMLSYPLKVTKGEIIFHSSTGSKSMLSLAPKELRALRGGEIAYIFQEPMNALDPVFTIEKQMWETLRFHTRRMSQKEMHSRSLAMLEKVRIPRPEQVLQSYPHQLSGGQLQRIMIAIALMNQPRLLIADEPTTALDVTIQAQILALLNALRKEYSMSVIMITHDLGVVAETCDRVAVLYAGQVVEQSDASTLFHKPAHPYTQGLLKAVTSLEDHARHLYAIRGTVPAGGQWADGCRFADRCDLCQPQCRKSMPALSAISAGHTCRCLAERKLQP